MEVGAKGEPTWLRDSGDRLLLLVLLAASLTGNVILGWKLRRAGGAIDPPPVGQTVPSLLGTNFAGKTEAILLRGARRPTVLYFFRPGCRWCERNAANIQALAGSRHSCYRFVAISLSDEELKPYLAAHPFAFDVYSGVSAATLKQLGVRGTPQTIVVSTEGRVMKNWSGAFTGDVGRGVESQFGVRLPGLTAERTSAE